MDYATSMLEATKGRSVWDPIDEEFDSQVYNMAVSMENDTMSPQLPTGTTSTPSSGLPGDKARTGHDGDTKVKFSSTLRKKLCNPLRGRDENDINFVAQTCGIAPPQSKIIDKHRSSTLKQDAVYEHRSYGKGKRLGTGGAQTYNAVDSLSPRNQYLRRVSWVDQISNTNNPSSHDTPNQAPHCSKAAPSTDNGSTLSYNSPPNSTAPLTPSTRNVYKTICKSQGAKLNRASKLAALPNPSPFQGSIWDPSDDEWAEVDAHLVAETFGASFRDPSQYSPRKAQALTRWGSSIQSTITQYLPASPTKTVANKQLREEELLRDKVEVLQNPYFCDPEGDVGDEVMEAFRMTGSQYFDGGREMKAMHVLDLQAYFQSGDMAVQQAKPRLGDAVATVLSHTSRQCVEAFLDPQVQEFVYRRELERSKAGSILVVRRMGNQIIVSSDWLIRFSGYFC